MLNHTEAGLPLVSVLMTSYNREKYIGQAIESVLASTYTNFELIIVDDCSKDSTVNIAEKYAAADQRIKVYLNEKNLGDYPNRNQAASYAVGKYLKYIDADDMIYPWGLEIMVSSMEKFPEAGYGLCSLEQHQKMMFPVQLSPAETYRYEYEGPGLFHKAPLSAIIKNEVFKAAGGFKSIRMCGDFEMWHRLSVTYPVVLMPHGLVWYRKHESQEMKDFDNYARSYENIRLSYITNSKNVFNDGEISKLLDIRKKELNGYVRRNLFRLKFKEAGEWKNLMRSYNL